MRFDGDRVEGAAFSFGRDVDRAGTAAFQLQGVVAALDRLDVGTGYRAAVKSDFVGAGVAGDVDSGRADLRQGPQCGLHLSRRRVVGQIGRRLATEAELEFAIGGFDVDQLDLVGPRGARQAGGFVGVRVGRRRPVFELAARDFGVVGVDDAFEEVTAPSVGQRRAGR